PAGSRLQLSRVRTAAAGPVVGDLEHRWRSDPPAVWWRRVRLQRHRREAVVSPEAAEAGAHRGGASGGGAAVAPLLVRNGGVVPCHRTRGGIRAGAGF